MALESGVTYIEDLVSTNPVGATDNIDQGDDHIRNIKIAIQGSLPSLGAVAVTKTAEQINDLAQSTSGTLTSPTINTGVSGTAILDEDDMATDSATQLATQQSIKAYADTKSSLTSGTVVTVSSGTTQDFTIPSGVTKIQIIASKVSATGAGAYGVQIGDAGGIEATGYEHNTGTIFSSSSQQRYTAATQVFMIGQGTAATSASGIMTLINITGNEWVFSGTGADESGTGAGAHYSAGTKTLTAELTTIRFVFTGTGTFSSGKLNVLYS